MQLRVYLDPFCAFATGLRLWLFFVEAPLLNSAVLKVGFALLLLFLVGTNALAQERHALLVGNAEYSGGTLQALNKPIQDVQVLQEALVAAGWPTSNVKIVTEVDRKGLYREVQLFAERVDEGVGFFYYSGHGGSAVINGSLENYLVPIGEDLKFAEDLPISGFRMSDLVQTFENTKAAGMFVVIDACRNALPSRGVRGSGMRGFRPIDSTNLFIAYATPDGQFAKDDGLYASVLAEEIRRESQNADNVFLRASRRVGQLRGTSQNPVVLPAPIGEMCFISCVDEFNPDEYDWRRFSKLEMYQEYLWFHPNGRFRDQAEAAIMERNAEATSPDTTLQDPQFEDLPGRTVGKEPVPPDLSPEEYASLVDDVFRSDSFACPKRNFTVFFERGSEDIPPFAKSQIDRVVSVLKFEDKCAIKNVELTGHSGRVVSSVAPPAGTDHMVDRMLNNVERALLTSQGLWAQEVSRSQVSTVNGVPERKSVDVSIEREPKQ